MRAKGDFMEGEERDEIPSLKLGDYAKLVACLKNAKPLTRNLAPLRRPSLLILISETNNVTRPVTCYEVLINYYYF